MAKIQINTANMVGKIKPMHAVGQPPTGGLGKNLFGHYHYITEIGALLLVTSLFLVIGFVFIVIIHLTYNYIYNVMLDYPNATLKECFHYCGEIMKGHRIRIFYLQASFIPLYILSIFSLGIGFLFVIPYSNIATTLFYLDVFKPDGEQAETVST